MPIDGGGRFGGSHRGDTERSCCGQLATSRRSLLKSALALGGTLAATQVFGEAVLQASYAGTPGAGSNVLVVLSMRGGLDGIGAVVPHADPGYYAARPTTAVPVEALLQRDSAFGLHPALAPLEPLWAGGELAAVHAVGLRTPNRSHFAAIEAIEDAAPGSAVRSGWLNRMVGLGGSASALSGVQLGTSVTGSAMGGASHTLTATSIKGCQVTVLDGERSQDRSASLGKAWAGTTGTPFGAAAHEAFAISTSVGATLSEAPTSTSYPVTSTSKDLCEALSSAAGLIRADIGTDAIAIDFGAFDLHARYGGVDSGLMQAQLTGFAGPLAAFFDDLGPLRSRVTVLTISEFGRRLVQNGNGGFDHGWGSVMFLAGAGVKGGRYYGTWPGLDPLAREDSDLSVTTDYRDVLAEVVGKRFPDRSLSTLFPGFSPTPIGFMT